jgi:glycosyltransferase involved in cell wall biosynthesis
MTYNNSKIGILLATFNSERFLKNQLHSIVSQTMRPHEIIISDDHSVDATNEILQSLHDDYGHSIRIDSGANVGETLGLHSNFRNLFKLALGSSCDVYLLSDHDDIWFSRKVETCVVALDSLNKLAAFGDCPLLVFSDLAVVDEQGAIVSTSFASYQGLPDPQTQPLERLLHQNVVTGCTCCFNRQLLEIAYPIPEEVVMHDHWLALCASVFGHSHYIDEPLVKYRQHGKNAVGAKRSRKLGLSTLLDPAFLKSFLIFPWHFAQSIEQAKALLKRIELSSFAVAEADLKTIKAFVMLKEVGLAERVRQGLKWVSMGNGFLERLYLIVVFAVLPYLTVRKAEDAI